MARHDLGPGDLSLLRWPSDPQVAPDGVQVAWTEVALDAELDGPVSCVMVGSTDGSTPPRRFSEGPHDGSPRWSPDGSALAYLSATDGPPRLLLAPLAGGAPTGVEAPGAVKWIEWSPTGDRLVLVVNVGAPSLASPATDARQAHAPRVVRGLANRLDGVGWRTGRDHLFVYDVARGHLRRLTTGDHDHAQPSWSPDGSTIVFVADRSRRRDDQFGMGDVLTVEAGARRAPRQVAADVADAGFPAYSPDGRHIAFTGLVGRAQTAGRDGKVLVIDADGTAPPAVVAPGLDRPVGFTLSERPFCWIGPDELLVAVADRGAVDLRRARLGDRSARLVVGGDREVGGVSIARRAGRPVAVFGSVWVDVPREILAVDLGGGARRPVQVSDAGAPLRQAVRLRPAERFQATAPDGLDVEYFVILPDRRRGEGPPPLFVEIHGGPHLHHPLGEMALQYQGIAAAGYAVVLPNPRGSTGYGGRFTALAGRLGRRPLRRRAGVRRRRHRPRSGRRRPAIPRRLLLRRLPLGVGDRAHESLQGGRHRRPGRRPRQHVRHLGRGHVPGRRDRRRPLVGPRPRAGPIADRVHRVGPDAGPALRERGRPPLPAEPERPAVLGLRAHGCEVAYVRYPGGSHLSAFPMIGPPSQNEDRLRRILEWCAAHGGVAPLEAR